MVGAGPCDRRGCHPAGDCRSRLLSDAIGWARFAVTRGAQYHGGAGSRRRAHVHDRHVCEDL